MKFRLISYFLILLAFSVTTLHFISTVESITGYSYGAVKLFLGLIPSLAAILVMQISSSIRRMMVIEQDVQKSFFIAINHFSTFLICLIWYIALAYNTGYTLNLNLRDEVLSSLLIASIVYSFVNFGIILILLRSISFFGRKK